MALTLTQLQAIKADIAANPDLAAVPAGLDGCYEIARLYNLPPAVAMSVWRTDTPVSAIFDAITWANYTPNDAADGTQLYQNRCYLVAIKQMNLQTMLTHTPINTANPLTRGGLRDALIQLPTGLAGVITSAGGASGVTVLNACLRNASRIEKALATSLQASDTTGTVAARVMGFEGRVSFSDIEQARAS